MKKAIIITVSVIILIGLSILMISRAISKYEDEQEYDLTKQSFTHKDKKPGGCYVFFKVLSDFYSSLMKPSVVTKPFADTFKKDKNFRGGYSLYVLVTNKMYATKQDVKDMISYASLGNQLFIAANSPDSTLLADLGLVMQEDTLYNTYCEQRYSNPALAPDTVFSRKGIYGGTFFKGMDSSKTTILGTDEKHRPNFVKVEVADGSVLFSLQPSIVTNYFVMHDKNMKSLETALSYTNYDVENVYWDEYYKYLDYRRSEGDFSEWQVLMRYPAMRWALLLAILLLLMYLLFEGKRRQRIIPDKPMLANNSMEFVNALGQLYYQQHDNANLARKIIQQWLEFIRTRYYLSTNYLNDTFVNTLAHKSGVPLQDVRTIVDQLHQIQLAEQISDDDLKVFYKNIQAFYLNTK